MKEVEGFFHGAKTMLAHFHFVCNGTAPFQIDWQKPEMVKFAKLDREQVVFMKESQSKIRDKSNLPFEMTLLNYA